MDNKGYSAIFYDRPDSSYPAEEYLLSLDKKMRAKVARNIKVVEADGPESREPYSKHLQDGIFEVRAQFSTNIARVLYFFFRPLRKLRMSLEIVETTNESHSKSKSFASVPIFIC